MHPAFTATLIPWLLLLQPAAGEPTAQSLIERHAKEKAPVWVDGDTATFFYRGDAEQVRLFFGGEEVAFRRLPDSDVWTATVTKPDMAKGIFTYAIAPGKKDEPKWGKKFTFERWRGPQAPPAAAKVKDLKGEVRTLDFDSQALGGKRKARVYLPPGHDRTRTYPVIYATDGQDGATILEPLITAGKIPPLITVATSSGDYQGDRAATYDIQKDLRALEYLGGLNADRYAAHEKFFCEELPAWAEREFGAAHDRGTRAVFGCSNGARFAVDMGVKHPDLFGHVFAFSVAGRREFHLPEKAAGLPHFHLAAGTWEPFLKTTTIVADELKKRNIPVTFVTRVAGHDMTMWDEELAAAAARAFGPAKPQADMEALLDAARTVVERLARGEFAEVAGQFDPQLAAVMSADKLRDSWADVVRRSGAFQRVAEVRPERRGTGDYVMLTCAFADRRFDVRLLFTERRQIGALRFVPTALGGPGLIRATSTATVRPAADGGEGTVTFPVPGTYRDQVPLDFVVTSTPANVIKGYRLVQREDGLNWLCEVRVAPPKEGALIRWEALVLVGDRAAEALPKATEPSVPEEAKPWLKSTGCVQSDDPAIRAKAEELARGAPDLEAYARRVIQFTGNNPVKANSYWTLDARSGLECGGSCTSRANLAAALLRARGIPARTVAHLPTWSGPLYEHWLVEYLHPGAGWVWLESSLNQFRPAPPTLVVINVANPADEDHPTTFASPRIRGVVPGAPYLSVQETSKELLPAFELRKDEAAASLATPEVALTGTPEELRSLFRAAAEAFARWPQSRGADTAGHGRADALVAAARTGGVRQLSQMLNP